MDDTTKDHAVQWRDAKTEAATKDQPELQNEPCYIFEYDFSSPSSAQLICSYSLSYPEPLGSDKLLFKRVQWSPDGGFLLSSNEDKTLKLFYMTTDDGENAPASSLLCSKGSFREAESILDFAWYPGMCSPDTSCFVSSCRDQPVHLWDIHASQIRCSYLATNHVDCVIGPTSLAFTHDGSKILGGAANCIFIWDAHRPGAFTDKLMACPTRKSRDGMKGIVSTIHVSASNAEIFAAGSFGGGIGIFDARSECAPSILCQNSRELGGTGVAQVLLSRSGTQLYAGLRQSNDIVVWDLRNTSQPAGRFMRKSLTNQRLYFDLDSTQQYLATGNTDGSFEMFGTDSLVMRQSRAHLGKLDDFLCKDPRSNNRPLDAVSAVHFHPIYPMLATCSGQRKFPIEGENTEDNAVSEGLCDASLNIWSFPGNWKLGFD